MYHPEIQELGLVLLNDGPILSEEDIAGIVCDLTVMIEGDPED
jgi:hypothetical protein